MYHETRLCTKCSQDVGYMACNWQGSVYCKKCYWELYEAEQKKPKKKQPWPKDVCRKCKLCKYAIYSHGKNLPSATTVCKCK